VNVKGLDNAISLATPLPTQPGRTPLSLTIEGTLQP
jgi:hypothetical protein